MAGSGRLPMPSLPTRLPFTPFVMPAMSGALMRLFLLFELTGLPAMSLSVVEAQLPAMMVLKRVDASGTETVARPPPAKDVLGELPELAVLPTMVDVEIVITP